MTNELALRASECAAESWAWVLSQVRSDAQGPWIPMSTPAGSAGPVSAGAVERAPAGPPVDRDCLYDGIGGLAFALAEIRLDRAWSEAEHVLADAIVERLAVADLGGDSSLYFGLAGSLTAITLLAPALSPATVQKLADRATPVGWPTAGFDGWTGPVHDVVLGNAGIVLACAWLEDQRADSLAALGADALVAAASEAQGGLSWKMYDGDRDRWMPNYSHGTAGIATALAIAGHRLSRPDLVDVARRGAEHLVAVADVADGGFRLPLQVPAAEDRETYAYGWCHGPTGTNNLFGALEHAGVTHVGPYSCTELIERGSRSLEASGLPARTRPGFWDNDGRCCGTAGVLDATLDRVQRSADPAAVAFADRLAEALIDRSVVHPDQPGQRFWQFHEHRADPPTLDPGVGWMQGAAGIAAVLARYARMRTNGPTAARVGAPDNWWM